MELDLTTGALINAGGALLFLLGGLGILALRPRARRDRLVAWTALTFGAAFVVENVLVESEVSGASVVLAAGATSLLTMAALTIDLAMEASRRARRWLVAAAAVPLAMLLTFLWLLVDPAARAAISPPVATLELVTATLLQLVQVVALLLAGAAAAAFHAAKDPRRQRALAWLALSVGLWAALINTSSAINAAYFFGRSSLWSAASFAWLARTFIAVGVAFAFVARPALDARTARIASSGIAVTCGAQLALELSGVEVVGSFGIVRTVGFVFLALAVLRHGLLDLPVPRLAVRSGPLAAATLATLFIVAQVAQNFFSEAYGLLTGGIVAGAFLFAAHPLQRAFEAKAAPKPAPVEARAPPERAARSERAYRTVLRTALRDGRISADEELALAHLADEAGLTTVRVTEIRHEVEKELGLRPA